MKTLLGIFLITVYCNGIIQAQSINYESSFEKAKSKAIKQKKLLAILITFKPPMISSNYQAGLNDKNVIEKFNSNFINYKADISDTAASKGILREYNISTLPVFIFLDSKGGFLFSKSGSLANPRSLLDLAEQAINTKNRMSLADYDSIYAAGNDDPEFIKEYILRRRSAGLTSNHELIEIYVNGLRVSDFNSYEEVLFILKAGPLTDGNAYRLANMNRKLIDSIYKTESLAERVGMNNIIIANTMNSAIESKNLSRAYAAANFAQSTWKDNPVEGQRNYSMKIMQYYRGVQDTVRFLQQATIYYEQIFRRFNIDSLRNQDSLRYLTSRNSQAQSTGTMPGQLSRYSYSREIVAEQLNSGALAVYQMAGNKSDYLFRIMMWSRKAVELNPNPFFFETYAYILYGLKFFDEAEGMLRKAIERGQAMRIDTRQYEEEYEKVRLRKL